MYLAEDLKHERQVALKVLKPELAAVVGAERFPAEIKTTANLQHPHILALHDSGEAGGTDGGTEPLWAHDGSELFYRNGDQMMTAPFDTATGLPGTATVLFESRYLPGYDVAGDGRFIMVRTPEESLPRQVNVVLNWFDVLKELMEN